MLFAKPVRSEAALRRMAEKAEALASTQAMSLAINTLLALSAAAILYAPHHDVAIGAWLGAALAVNLVRWALLCRPLRRFGTDVAAPAQLHLAAGSSLVAGLVWGVLPAVLMNFQTVEAPFVSIILCGLTAGAALQGGAYALPAIALAIPVLVPMAARSALLGTTSGGLLSFDILLYLAMVVRSSRAAELAFDRLVALRWHANSMAVDLKQRHEEALASADQLFRLANHDPLTGTANRAAFTARLKAWLEAAATRDGLLTLMLLDLDHFKAINDTLGHAAGDEVLTVTARRLDGFSCRDRFIARLGGDEFAILLSDCCDDGHDGEIAQEIIDQVAIPFDVGDEPIALGVSVGLARYPTDALTAEELLACADLALYAAKDAGRHAWRRFSPALLSGVERTRNIERDLPAALAAGELQVWFQPQVETLSARIVGLEALVRWEHVQLGWISPPEVVAAAAKIRRSEALTRFVLEGACAGVGWLDRQGAAKARVAVNISPREMESFDLVDLISRTLSRQEVDPHRLEVEITEEAVLSHKGAVATLAALRSMGVRLALDDFGTGNSAIAYLRKVMIDRLKIDRSFVQDMVNSDGDRALVGGIIGLGRSLSVEVLAEGVETQEQALLLSSLGCHLAQGHLYGAARPLRVMNDEVADAPAVLGFGGPVRQAQGW